MHAHKRIGFTTSKVIKTFLVQKMLLIMILVYHNSIKQMQGINSIFFMINDDNKV